MSYLIEACVWELAEVHDEQMNVNGQPTFKFWDPSITFERHNVIRSAVVSRFRTTYDK